MRRRETIAALGTVATLLLTAQAQQPVPLVGLLTSLSQADHALRAPAFAKGLAEQGYVAGRNVKLEIRTAAGQFERLPALAAELVAQRPTVIAAISPPAAIAAKAASSTIPVAFMVGLDPIRIGLVTNLSRPEANLTGTYILIQDLGTKRFGLLRELIPGVSMIGVLVHSSGTDTATQLEQLQAAARAVSQPIIVADAATETEIEAAFVTFADKRVQALIVLGDAFFFTQRRRIVDLAARHRIPAMYHQRDFVEAGGLMTYATNLADGYRLTGNYVGRFLKGDKPGDLPVQQASRVEFIINLKTAKALGIEFHPQLLATADEVIE